MREYTVRVDDEGVRSEHDTLVRLAEHSRRASRLSQDDIEVDGPDDDVAEYLELVVNQETKRSQSR